MSHSRICTNISRISLIFVMYSCPFAISVQEVGIKIKKGESAAEVADKLCKEGVILHPLWFKVWLKLTDNERKIKAGYYRFTAPTSIREVSRKLVRGESVEFPIIVKEGSTLKEIADLFSQECGVDKEEFLRLAQDSMYVRRFGLNANSLEGYLFPETYLVTYGVDPHELIERMVEQFFIVFTDEFKTRATATGFSMEEAVILASLIEKEAACEEEKKVISGVYHKRLKMNKLLQCDATIQYILPERKPRLTYSDLRINSKYNTYIYKGFPPGSIASPGKSSLIAALWPEATPYLFFVARGDGTHIFSRTLDEHNRAKKEVASKSVVSR